MILVPFKNGWTDLTKLLCVGSVSVREKLFGRKKPNLVSGFAGKTRQNWIIMIFIQYKGTAISLAYNGRTRLQIENPKGRLENHVSIVRY